MSHSNPFLVRVFQFYYAYSRLLNRILPSIRMDGKKIYVAPSVYKPLEHEQRLADYCVPGSRVLDLGCGTGVVMVFTAAIAREVVAVDISPAAVENARRNSRMHGLSNTTVLQSDMFAAVEGCFDLIIAHPPYFQLEMTGEDAQFATSVTFLDVLFQETKNYLADGGRLLVQYPKFQRQRLEQLAKAGGLRLVDCRRAKRKGPGLLLTSLLYVQFGNRSHQFFFERRED
jgi:methylase of polypeptide subunit release factors